MSLSIKGRITKVLQLENGTSKAGKAWEKQSFVLDTGAQYSPEVCFSVEVAFNVSSREFNGKYYHNLDAYKISPLAGVENNDDLPY